MSPQVHQQPFSLHNNRYSIPPPPPPPVAHKVWILDCKSCGTFLTNRGMKAVLLLRPNVSLYSSDAQPANCSPWSAESEIEQSESTSRRVPSPARTCECLTQTLCCHGCGNSVGYMIVLPCSRCTSSIATSNRSTNGHRFVFHSSEIQSVQRRYIPDEKGVKPFEPVYYPPPIWREYGSHYPLRETTSPSRHAPPLNASPTNAWHPLSERADDVPPPHPRPTTNHEPSSNGAYLSPPTFVPSNDHQIHQSQEHKDYPLPRRLVAGEYLYWHSLIRGGEILGVQNDQRARRPWTPGSPDSGDDFLSLHFDH